MEKKGFVSPYNRFLEDDIFGHDSKLRNRMLPPGSGGKGYGIVSCD